MVLTPAASAMFATDHEDVPVAIPDASVVALDHDTVIVPDPPETVPDKFTVDAVVVPAIAFTLNVNAPGAGVGAGVGAGAALPWAA